MLDSESRNIQQFGGQPIYERKKYSTFTFGRLARNGGGRCKVECSSKYVRLSSSLMASSEHGSAVCQCWSLAAEILGQEEQLNE